MCCGEREEWARRNVQQHFSTTSWFCLYSPITGTSDSSTVSHAGVNRYFAFRENKNPILQSFHALKIQVSTDKISGWGKSPTPSPFSHQRKRQRGWGTMEKGTKSCGFTRKRYSVGGSRVAECVVGITS